MPKIYENYGQFAYRITNDEKSFKVLPKGIYEVNKNPITGEYFIMHSNPLTLPEKVYGIEKNFIKRVLKFWKDATPHSLGVLLNGLRGTGKSHTAKIIALATELPVIKVTFFDAFLPQFIQSLPQDVVVFFDEFEKMYSRADAAEVVSLLSALDGPVQSDFRRLWLFTTNSLNINENFLQRPSRIRYVKTFESLDKKVVEEIVSDRIKNKKLKADTLEALAEFEFLTFDLVNSFITEVLTIGQSPEELLKDFNVEKKINNTTFNVYNVKYDKQGIPIKSSFVKMKTIHKSRYTNFKKLDENDSFSIEDSGGYFYIKQKFNDYEVIAYRDVRNKKGNYVKQDFLITIENSSFNWRAPMYHNSVPIKSLKKYENDED